ncbi:type II secretion system F family protein [Actinomycetaceae bacterium TAE3-ERU4]|nr:type II secretion system F family protein [Actinomycetaceae bacterium TAE3-ERU4]
MLLGIALGALSGIGLVLILLAYGDAKITMARRIEPYLRFAEVANAAAQESVSVLIWHFIQKRASGYLEYFGSTNASLRRRIRQANLGWQVQRVRIFQILGALIALLTGLLGMFLMGVVSSRNWGLWVVFLIIFFIAGLLFPDYLLTYLARQRQLMIDKSVPDCCELLALSVTAGQSIVEALGRVQKAVSGPLSKEIEITLGAIRTGQSVSSSLGKLKNENNSPALDRLCEALITALERGSPLSEVLRSQSLDAREAQRRALIEEGGKREIAMLVPVVFLILPITILFALYPGLMSLKIGF